MGQFSKYLHAPYFSCPWKMGSPSWLGPPRPSQNFSLFVGVILTGFILQCSQCQMSYFWCHSITILWAPQWSALPHRFSSLWIHFHQICCNSQVNFFLGEGKNVGYPVTVIPDIDVIFRVANMASLPFLCIAMCFHMPSGLPGISE